MPYLFCQTFVSFPAHFIVTYFTMRHFLSIQMWIMLLGKRTSTTFFSVEQSEEKALPVRWCFQTLIDQFGFWQIRQENYLHTD